MKPRTFRLSKSRLISGLQCDRRLWLETFCRELQEVDDAQQAIFDNGNELGELARELLGPGVLIEHVREIALALTDTERLLSIKDQRQTLFEPAFSHSDVVVRADALVPVAHGYDLIEVKGSTSVKDYYINDCAIQAWVIENAGIKLSRIRLAHLDNTFVYQGDGDYQGLLHIEDITDQVRERMADVPGWVKRLCTMLAKPEPAIGTGDHCDIPFGCPFYAHCRAQEPAESEYPVSVLPRATQLIRILTEEGFEDLRSVPPERLSSHIHKRVHAATVSGLPYLDPQASGVLAKLSYPRHYLDFETIGFAVPRWAKTRTYQQVPFQWSCQIEQRDGSIGERSFLDLSGNSPMRAFAESLLEAVGERGPIIVYNQGFEATRIRELAEIFPELSRKLNQLIPRMFDLLPLTRDCYYHPAMKGSWSIKSVLPTIAPDMAYEDLDEVADGGGAQVAYREAIQPETTGERRTVLEDALRRYCANDTLGMVRLASALAQ